MRKSPFELARHTLETCYFMQFGGTLESPLCYHHRRKFQFGAEKRGSWTYLFLKIARDEGNLSWLFDLLKNGLTADGTI